MHFLKAYVNDTVSHYCQCFGLWEHRLHSHAPWTMILTAPIIQVTSCTSWRKACHVPSFLGVKILSELGQKGPNFVKKQLKAYRMHKNMEQKSLLRLKRCFSATTTNLTLHLLSREKIRLCLEGCESPGSHWLKSHAGNWFSWGSQRVRQLGDKHECIGCCFNPMEKKTLVKMGIFPEQLWRVLNHHLQQYLWNCSLPVFLLSPSLAKLAGRDHPTRQLEDQLFSTEAHFEFPANVRLEVVFYLSKWTHGCRTMTVLYLKQNTFLYKKLC